VNACKARVAIQDSAVRLALFALLLMSACGKEAPCQPASGVTLGGWTARPGCPVFVMAMRDTTTEK
jgi:hypothetical protein